MICMTIGHVKLVISPEIVKKVGFLEKDYPDSFRKGHIQSVFFHHKNRGKLFCKGAYCFKGDAPDRTREVVFGPLFFKKATGMTF